MVTHEADEWREKVRLVKKNYPVGKLRGSVAKTRREQGSTKFFRLCQYRDGVDDMFPESEAHDRLFATNGAWRWHKSPKRNLICRYSNESKA